MRILLADDQIEVRSGLRILLEQEPHVKVVGEAGGIRELLAQVLETGPDMVLLDWELSNLNMADFVPVLRALHTGLSIVALSGRPESRSSAAAAGVDVFVSKGDQPEKLLEAINGICNEKNCPGA
ncbi:MAG: response regulator [Clostridiales bacterium]|jgi:DNA-binding NarL/FixJ family response regulator|nr:response regulator [Eubacteriales bacterium]MDH7566713.1 response regulator [Clostridiales bacterium]